MVWVAIIYISVWGYNARLMPEQRTAFASYRNCTDSIPVIRKGLRIQSPVTLRGIDCERFPVK